MIFQSIALFAVAACSPVGLVVDVPIFEGLAVCLVVVGCKKGGLFGFVDEVVFGCIGEHIEQLLCSGIVVETGVDSGSVAEEMPLSVSESIDVSCDEAVDALEERGDVRQLFFCSGEEDVDMIDVAFNGIFSIVKLPSEAVIVPRVVPSTTILTPGKGLFVFSSTTAPLIVPCEVLILFCPVTISLE